MKSRMMIIAGLIAIPSSCFAFFCPTNFAQIDFGNTTAEVTAICGKPDKEESKEVEPNVPQEWDYYIPSTVSTRGMQATTGTLKTQIAFDEKGNVINISVNGIGVGESTICGSSIKLGDNKDAIKAACGDPVMINKQQTTGEASLRKIKITEFTYNTNPPVKLIFEDGKLKDKQ